MKTKKKVIRCLYVLWKLPWLVVAIVGMILYLFAIGMMYGFDEAEKMFNTMR